jgi:hypothetical protein
MTVDAIYNFYEFGIQDPSDAWKEGGPMKREQEYYSCNTTYERENILRKQLSRWNREDPSRQT